MLVTQGPERTRNADPPSAQLLTDRSWPASPPWFSLLSIRASQAVAGKSGSGGASKAMCVAARGSYPTLRLGSETRGLLTA